MEKRVLIAVVMGWAGFGQAQEAPPEKPPVAPASTFQRLMEEDREFLKNTPAAVPQQTESMPPEGTRSGANHDEAVKTAPFNVTDVQAFVRDYLAAAAEPTPDRELAFYSKKVDYFNQGTIQKKKVARDQEAYYRRFPYREFTLLGEPRVLSINPRRCTVEFDLAYRVGDGYRTVQGRSQEKMTLAFDGEGLRIVGIRERKF